MKARRLLLSFIFTFSTYLLSSQVPQGFNYQAIARDGSGNLIANATIKVKLSILSDTTGFYLNGTGTYIWEEEQASVKTNASGLFSVIFGNPSALKIQGTAATFSTIPWTTSPLYIGTKVANPTTYKNMGSARLWSVPYSMLSGGLSGSPAKLTVKGTEPSRDSALFEVKNVNGETVFAVYDEGVRVYVGNGVAKGATKGGFAIGELSQVKAPGTEYFRVTRDSTRVYVNPNAKGGTKGGFAIGETGVAKAFPNSWLNMTANNYLIGQRSGMNITTGIYNSFIGYESGKANTSGTSNIFLGYNGGISNTSGNNNVFIGNESGHTNSTNSNNVFLGYYAGYTNTADNNLFLGTESGRYNTTGTSNSFLGYFSGRANTTGSSNVFIGNQSGTSNTTGYSNIMIGDNAGYNNQTGYSNIIMGRLAGFSGTNHQFNIFMGDSAGYFTNNQFATRNVMIGYAAGKNTQSYNNIFIGNLAGWANSSGQNNIAIGDQAGYSNSTSQNIFIGTQAGKNNSSGYFNVFIGRQAGLTNTTGYQQILIGGGAGSSLTTGNENIIMGVNAGAVNSTGNRNIFIGNNAGWSNTGSDNIIMGYKVGYAYFQTVSNRLIIDNSQVAAPLIWGEFDNRRLVINGTNANNTSNLTFFVNGTSGGASAWSNLSDARLKKNISEISDALSKVLELRGVNYEWSDPASPEKGTRIGFIAQEVEKVIPEVVNTEGQYYSMQYGPLAAVIVEAMKEQQKIIDKQKSEIQTLTEKLNALNSRLDKIESSLTQSANKK